MKNLTADEKLDTILERLENMGLEEMQEDIKSLVHYYDKKIFISIIQGSLVGFLIFTILLVFYLRGLYL